MADMKHDRAALDAMIAADADEVMAIDTTAVRRAALVKKVARAMCVAEDIDPDMIVDNHTPTCPGPVWRIFTRQATAAINLLRAEVLEEAARVVRGMPSPSSEWMADELLRALGGLANPVPDAIRALKDTT